MIAALDENNLIQRNLRREFEYFFEIVKKTDGFEELEKEMDSNINEYSKNSP